MDADDRIRRAIGEHGRASESGDNEPEHAVYELDAVLDDPPVG
jgi:hypothetical protein